MSRESESVPEEEVGAWKTGMLPSHLSECNSKDIINARNFWVSGLYPSSGV
jgi:hypothetical protein